VPSGRRIGLIATAVLLAATAAGLAYVALETPTPGLHARVFRNATFAGVPIATVADHTLSVDDLARTAGLPDTAPFSVDWTGWVVIEQAGDYHYQLGVDDGVVVWFGEHVMIDVTGPPGSYDRRGVLTLTRGVYPVEIRYVQYLGKRRFSLRWSPPGNRVGQVNPLFFQPGAAAPTLASVMLVRRLPLWLALSGSAWISVALAALAWRLVSRPVIARGRRQNWIVLGVLAACAVVIVPNVTWGMFPWRDWFPDEVTPADTVYAFQQRLAGGWFSLYPPLHFVVSGVVMSPLLIAERLHWLSFDAPEVVGARHLSGRLITVGMALMALVALVLIGDETIGRRRALAAAFFVGTTQLFAYYAKSANVDVPYVFWVTVALLFYVRAAKYGRLADHVLLGAVAACAITTKDQAYGFFTGPALVLVFLTWRRHTAAGRLERLRRTLLDARLWGGLVTFAAVLAAGYGIPWNYHGFMNHVDLATGWRMSGFRMFAPTLTGQWQLLIYTVGLLPWTMGVVPAILSIAGVVVAVTRRRRFRWLWLLAAPLLSYYATVVMTIGYVYDRFLLAWLIVIALFAALGLDWLWRTPRLSRAVRVSLAAACLVAAIVPAARLNIEMAFGTRQRLERWMAQHAGADTDPLVVATGNRRYLPALASYRHVIVNTPGEDIVEWKADLIVLNEDWLTRIDLPRATLVAALGRASYTEVYRDAPAAPPWWTLALSGWPPGAEATNLLKVSPSYTVWQRTEIAP
jgi:4-amino-4-deoxy-L-arabinose transferase-like glycosyltransferase